MTKNNMDKLITPFIVLCILLGITLFYTFIYVKELGDHIEVLESKTMSKTCELSRTGPVSTRVPCDTYLEITMQAKSK